MKFIARWVVTAIAAAAAIHLVSGVTLVGGDGWMGLALFSLVLALVDAIIKPIFKVISLPISFLTLGIFSLFINTIMLYLASSLSGGIFGISLEIASFGSAFLCSLIISAVSALSNLFSGD